MTERQYMVNHSEYSGFFVHTDNIRHLRTIYLYDC